VTTNYNTKSGEDGAVADVVTSVRLPSVLHAKVKSLAERQHRTFNQQVRLALSEHVDANPEPEELAA
jgi:predicted transcriptional regulator